MSSGFTAPLQSDFQACSQLMGEQAEHLAALEKWLHDQCLGTDGLDRLLAPMAPVVPRVAKPLTVKLGECQRGLAGAAGTLSRAGEACARDAEASSGAVADGDLFPAPLPHFPDLRALHLPQVGGFTDEPVTLTPPASAKEDTKKNTRDDLLALQAALGNGPLGLAERAFLVCTGQDLIGLLIHPLLGEYGQLKYLHEAYRELADGSYTVAATIRKGSWALSDEWAGDTAVAFDSYMFRWSMGVGGIGDAATVVGKAYGDAYDAVMPLVDTALVAINMLMKKELRQLAELAAGDAASMLFGGPLNPVADVVALVNTAFRVYETIRLVILGVHSIRKIYDEISKVVKDVHLAMDKVIHYATQPVQSVKELIDHLEERGFEFEKNSAWRPELGVARMTMLPSAPGTPEAGAAEPAPEDQDDAPADVPDEAEVPEHQAIARRIYEHLKAGGEVEEVRGLITDFAHSLTGHPRSGDELAPSGGGPA